MKRQIEFREERLLHLFRNFQAAYRNRGNARVQDSWQKEVMGSITRMGSREHEDAFFPSLMEITWRLSPAAAILILICAYSLINFEPISIWQVLSLSPVELPDMATNIFFTAGTP